MSKKRFEEIVEIMCIEKDGVESGKMMSAPGLMYKSKVFAFFYKDKMVFKLGKDYDIESHDIKDFTYLNPFKNKGPMKAWFEIEEKYNDKWMELSEVALIKMKEQVDK